MNQYDMCEQAYKNGYSKGYEKGLNEKVIRVRDVVNSLDNLGYRIIIKNEDNILYDGEASLVKFLTNNYSKYFVDKINISDNNSIFITVIED